MNRHERRRGAAIGRAAAEEAAKGARWSQRADPEDPTYALIEMRIPTGPNRMPEATYVGGDAMNRARRFATGFLQGVADGERERGSN